MVLIRHEVLLSDFRSGLSSITSCREMYSTFFALFRTDKHHSHFFISEPSAKSLTAYSNNKNLWIFQRFPLHYDTNIFLLIKISSDNFNKCYFLSKQPCQVSQSSFKSCINILRNDYCYYLTTSIYHSLLHKLTNYLLPFS